MCGCVYVGCSENCMGVLVIRVLVYTAFCIVYTVFFCTVSIMYIYSYLLCPYSCNRTTGTE
jgi:uncharacterized membrane protein (DUF106 family)